MRGLGLLAGAALLAACAGQQAQPLLISGVTAQTDLAAVGTREAVSQWQNLDEDLETAIAAQFVGRIDPLGKEIHVDVDEFSLNSFTGAAPETARLAGRAHVTPVLFSRSLDQASGARVYLKCENLQRVGAFKFRGAYNAISRLSPDLRARGVLAYSSGNHAQAVALVGKLLGAPTTIVMPAAAPAIKRDATEAFGATIVPYDPATQSREAIAESWLRMERITVSRSTHSAKVPSTRMIGEPGKYTSPSW